MASGPPTYQDGYIVLHLWLDSADGELRARIRAPELGPDALTAAVGREDILLLVERALDAIDRGLRR